MIDQKWEVVKKAIQQKLLIPYSVFVFIFSLYVIWDWEVQSGISKLIMRIIIYIFVAYFINIEII